MTCFSYHFFLIVPFVTLLDSPCLADLPPHCLHGDMLGTWQIHSGQWYPCKGDADVTDSFCGYSLPDRPDTHASAGLIPLNISPKFQEDQTFNVIFTPRHVVESDSGKGDDSESDINEPFDWTMVYDEGVDWTFKGNRYFAYFKYEFVTPEHPTATSERIRSYCSTTMIGWWRSIEDGDVNGCWWGQKLYNRHNDSKIDPNQWTNEIPSRRPSLMEIAKHDPEYMKYAIKQGGIDYIVNKILAAKSPNGDGEGQITKVQNCSISVGDVHWKPINKNRVMIGDEEVTSIQRLNQLIGDPRLFGVNIPRVVNQFLPIVSLPLIWKTGQGFDWTNPDDVYKKIGVRASVIPPTIHQTSCGSCYALAAARMLTSRIWIKNADDPSIFRKLYVDEFPMISCSVLSQGCNGGYIFLALKSASERKRGLPSKDCVERYDGGINNGISMVSIEDKIASETAMLFGDEKKCYDVFDAVTGSSLKCSGVPIPQFPSDCKYRIHVNSYRYLGGAYGHGTEQEMIEALLERGPFATSIEPTPELGVYRTGIFHTPIKFLPEYRKNDKNFPWIKVDHAVLVVGFGLEIDPYSGKGIPYWKLQNSWGPHWGEDGYFRVIRGINEIAIEHSPVEGEAKLHRIIK